MSQTKKILIVDDDPADQRLLSSIIQSSVSDSIKLLGASSLAEAIDTVRISTISVAVLDLNLADSSGVDTVHRLRIEAPNLSIIAVTGAEDRRLGCQCIEAGASDFVHKASAIAPTIARVLSHSFARQQEQETRQRQQLAAVRRGLHRVQPRPAISAPGGLRDSESANIDQQLRTLCVTALRATTTHRLSAIHGMLVEIAQLICKHRIEIAAVIGWIEDAQDSEPELSRRESMTTDPMLVLAQLLALVAETYRAQSGDL